MRTLPVGSCYFRVREAFLLEVIEATEVVAKGAAVWRFRARPVANRLLREPQLAMQLSVGGLISGSIANTKARPNSARAPSQVDGAVIIAEA